MTLEAPWGALLVVASAFFGGLVNGLTGFGTGMTALPFWVHALPPPLVSPLVVACSIVSQLQTLPAIWHVYFRRVPSSVTRRPRRDNPAGRRGRDVDERRPRGRPNFG